MGAISVAAAFSTLTSCNIIRPFVSWGSTCSLHRFWYPDVEICSFVIVTQSLVRFTPWISTIGVAVRWILFSHVMTVARFFYGTVRCKEEADQTRQKGQVCKGGGGGGRKLGLSLSVRRWMFMRSSEESISCAPSITFLPQKTADILNSLLKDKRLL